MSALVVGKERRKQGLATFLAKKGSPISYRQLTALFTNMRILKFKSQLTIAFFAAVNHLNGPLMKQNFILTGSKGLDPFCEFLCFKVRCL